MPLEAGSLNMLGDYKGQNFPDSAVSIQEISAYIKEIRTAAKKDGELPNIPNLLYMDLRAVVAGNIGQSRDAHALGWNLGTDLNESRGNQAKRSTTGPRHYLNSGNGNTVMASEYGGTNETCLRHSLARLSSGDNYR
ncbi:hypothetical protein J6590_016474 [Homalodisca vitripennis]|nr:hypothetical protein J6590_016474 [Homalodisca vitripennis]